MNDIISFLESSLIFLAGLVESLLSVWWLILPVLLIMAGASLWRFHQKEKYKSEMDWTLIEVKVPKEIEKTPKAMEQVFAAVHAVDTKVKFKDKWLNGKVANWITFELIGRAGGIRFIIRTPSDFKNLVESAIYSQYPNADTRIVPEEEDYVHQFPKILPNKEYDIAGAELILKKEDGFPIRTWEYFEDKDEKRLDPMSSIMETMSKLKPSEAIWIQIIIRPAGDDWVKEGEKLADKLWNDKKKASSNLPEPFKTISEWTEAFFEFTKNFFLAFFQHPAWAEGGEDKKDDSGNKKLSPGKEKVVEAVENKISKLGFKGSIRFLYIDKRDEFTKSNVASVQGAFRQFSTNNMNTLDVNKKAMKGHPALITKNRKEFQGKRKYYSNYINREFPDKTSVFNTEELATIYHLPLTQVKSPKLQKTEFRKGGPPADLPTLDE